MYLMKRAVPRKCNLHVTKAYIFISRFAHPLTLFLFLVPSISKPYDHVTHFAYSAWIL